MKKQRLIFSIFILIIIIISESCILVDYFSGYDGKNLISHTDLTDWSASYGSPYMEYSAVSSAAAGTSGLPDTGALIYRLENKNLISDGDFEASTAGNPPAGAWTNSGGTFVVRDDSYHPLNGNALYFNLNASEYISFPMNSLLDGASVYNSYIIRFDFSGNRTGEYMFMIDNASDSSESMEFLPSVPSANTSLSFPEDFSTVPLTEFTIHVEDDEYFRINKDSVSGAEGYIDDIRIVKSDQRQTLSILLPFNDADRIDSLTLISGWYRFSIYVKLDPYTGTGNRFASDSVTLSIYAIDDDGMGDSSKSLCFNAEDYNSFTEWTLISIDAELQIDEPADPESGVIKLSISPCCTVSGAIGTDAGSILISNPVLEFSPTASF